MKQFYAHSRIVHGSFHTILHLNSCNSMGLVHKALNIHCLALYRKGASLTLESQSRRGSEEDGGTNQVGGEGLGTQRPPEVGEDAAQAVWMGRSKEVV